MLDSTAARPRSSASGLSRVRRTSALLAAGCLLTVPGRTQEQEPVGDPQTAAATRASARGAWCQWRGPSRDGHAPATPAWPARLEGHLERLWHVPLGPSYSGPVVDAERVYTTMTEDQAEEVALAFDRKTGEKVWEARWKGAITVPFFAARNGSWIRSTPALADGRLFVGGMQDVLVCLDAATGEELWRADFPSRFDVEDPAFGFVCSPLVVGDSVYVQAGASVVRLAVEDGEVLWRGLEDGGGMFGGAFSSPILAEVAGREQLLVQSRTTLAGMDPAEGGVLWQQPIKSFRGMAILTPIVFGDSVFMSTYGDRGHLFRVTAADDGMQVEEVWDSRAQAYMTSPVVIDDHAYLYLRSKRFTCVDLRTGESKWISPNLGDEYWSLVAQGDRILALTNAGELLLIAADPSEYRVLDSVEVAAVETWAHLAVDDGELFVREQEGLTAWAWRSEAVAAPGAADGGDDAGDEPSDGGK
jgi:outer membrane protein assembly factor BamB